VFFFPIFRRSCAYCYFWSERFDVSKYVCIYPSSKLPMTRKIVNSRFLSLLQYHRVANNALPATFAIHRALKNELNVVSRIGATYGKVYCGVVGGVRRHEFAVMGAPVNLAARLMASKVNSGILVDEAVGQQAGNRFSFKTLPPVEAKGYDNPVPILEPLGATVIKKRKTSYPFTGRAEEKRAIASVAHVMLEKQTDSLNSMVFLMGESGVGKSALAAAIVEEIRKENSASEDKKIIVAARSTSDETQQRVPLRYGAA
jgi:chromosomal replication initiation ATPase DnaA